MRSCRFLLAAALLFACGTAAAALTTAEAAGKKIFEEGVSASGGAITAKVGDNPFDIPGTAVPCANCHGQDGLGRPEGGVVPPNIQWSELTKSYGHVHPRGRRHPVFTEAGVAKAVAFGVDPGGNDLDPAMPRYRMPDEDMRSLIAYLKKIEFQLPPGVAAKSLRIGTVLPESGRFAEIGRLVRDLLQASFDRINGKGGLYGRKLELVVADYGENATTAYTNAWELLRRRDVFALLAPLSAGWEGELGRVAAEERIPVIAPITLFPEDTRASNLYVFHLLSGVAELSQVLAVHAAAALNLKDQRVALLHAEGKAGAELAQAVDARLTEQGWSALLPRQGFRSGAADVAALARSLKEAGAQAVFVLGPGLDVAAFARAAEQLQWRPYLLLPGALAPRDIVELPASYQGRVFLAYPTLPADQRPPATQDYAALFHGKAPARSPQAIQAYAATVVAVEALKQVGKDLNRQKFTAAIEALQGFDTGMLPPLSYNGDRRIGALGGYVVAVDLANKQFQPVGGFVPVPAQ